MFNIEIPSLSSFTQTSTTELTELSSVLEFTQSALISARAALTAIPQHPYDIMKLTYFDKDHKFPTINDVKVPPSVSLDTINKGIENILNEHQDRILNEIANNDTPFTNFEAYSMLSELSSNGKWITTPDKYRKYIEFFEVLKSVDVKSLTSADIARDVAGKFSYVLLQALSQKTIQN
jgi:hypothetical protein